MERGGLNRLWPQSSARAFGGDAGGLRGGGAFGRAGVSAQRRV